MSRATSRRNVASVEQAASVFAALGDEIRLALVHRLGQGRALSITRLTEETCVTRQAVTKHLQVLERAGLVRAERQGRELLWQVNPHRLNEARRYLAQLWKHGDDALERLATFVEH